jgi:hypothetical protein
MSRTGVPAEEQELLAIRKTIIVAIASDESLMERLILKGGNALDIVHRLSERSSLDVDFSMSGDFRDAEDLRETSERLFAALRDRFDSIGYVVFDEKLEPRPRPRPTGLAFTAWGGYNATFKLLTKEQYRDLGGMPGTAPSGSVLEHMRRQAQVAGPNFVRKFEIEISKFEYTEGRVPMEVDSYTCYVYTPAMIAAEKLRAICQQLREYTRRANPAPRPRDFFDIHTIATKAGCDLAAEEHHDLIRQMFAAKEVPLELIARVGEDDVRAFHAQQWQSVVDSVRGGPPKPFDFYFDFVAGEAARLLSALNLPPSAVGGDTPFNPSEA